MEFTGRAILLDIEGTTSSVSFVYDVMFPLVRRELSAFLRWHWKDVDVQLACDQLAQDAGHTSTEAWCGPNSRDQCENVEAEVIRLMDQDVKATGLKQLQGLIWRRAFQKGEIKAHVYADVPRCLQCWRDAGKDIRIYSSGSVHAQHLFFGHTKLGDLRRFFTGHYDTTIGSKKEPVSYERIAADWKLTAHEILFLSDIVPELDAAKIAGLRTGLCQRPGNADVEPGHGHPNLSSFSDVVLI